MFHLWGFWVMVVIFNLPLMLSLSSVASSLAKLVPQTRCNGKWKVMKKGKCSRKKCFTAVVLVTNEPGSQGCPNLRRCVHRVGGDPPAAGLLPARESKCEVFLFPDEPPAPQLRSTPRLLSCLGTTQRYRQVQNTVGEKSEPLFSGKWNNNGLSKPLWSAWQHPDHFSSPALCRDRSRAAALKALAPSSRRGFGVVPGGPRNPHSGPKTRVWEHTELLGRLDDLR